MIQSGVALTRTFKIKTCLKSHLHQLGLECKCTMASRSECVVRTWPTNGTRLSQTDEIVLQRVLQLIQEDKDMSPRQKKSSHVQGQEDIMVTMTMKSSR